MCIMLYIQRQQNQFIAFNEKDNINADKELKSIGSYGFGDVSASEAVKRVVTEQLQPEGIDSLESCGLGCSTPSRMESSHPQRYSTL